MRVNVYAEEMTDRVEVISKTTEDGEFTGLRIYLELPCTIPLRTQGDGYGDSYDSKYTQNVRGPFIHRPGDDDSAAVTFWGKKDLRGVLVRALEALDAHYMANPSKDFGDDGRKEQR
jgi:hypothetical protein